MTGATCRAQSIGRHRSRSAFGAFRFGARCGVISRDGVAWNAMARPANAESRRTRRGSMLTMAAPSTLVPTKTWCSPNRARRQRRQTGKDGRKGDKFYQIKFLWLFRILCI